LTLRLAIGAVGVALLMACATPATLPTHTVDRAEIQASLTQELNLGLLLTELTQDNIKKLRDADQKSLTGGLFGSRMLFDKLLLPLELTFRSVTIYESAKEAWAAGIDILGRMDYATVYDKGFMWSEMDLKLTVAFEGPNGKKVGTVRGQAYYKGPPDIIITVEEVSENVKRKVSTQIAKSTALQAYARGVAARPTPVAGAQPAPKTQDHFDSSRSEVDRPAYKGPEDPNLLALVIGIENYSELPEARFAERDAAAMREHLLAMGFAARNILFLSGERAGRAAFVKYIESWLPRNVERNSTVFIYFAGHGAPDPEEKQAYLLPYDGDPEYLKNTGYPLKRLYEELSALKARRVILVLDTCFSGAGGRSVLPKGTRPLVTQVQTSVASLENFVVLRASADNEITSLDQASGHGLFTYHLLKALNEARGGSTISELYQALKPRVEDAARRQNRSQTPGILPAARKFKWRLKGAQGQ